MRKGTFVLSLLAILTMGIAFLSSGSTKVGAANTIENYYKAQGSYAVSTGTATDGNGYTYHLWYPTNMTSGHAIISFGVGTGGTPTDVADMLDQLASWGFVVIANDNGTQGLGQYIVAGAQYMVAQNSNSGSIFYNKLDTTKIGAFGHSQGAGGVMNAIILQPTLFKSAVPNALPDKMWWTTPVPTVAQLNAMTVPMWIQCGASDWLICSNSSIDYWYKALTHAPAARALAKGAGHNEITLVNNKYEGYDTAWFRYTLKGDTYARGAFAGTSPELPTNTANWQSWASKSLP